MKRSKLDKVQSSKMELTAKSTLNAKINDLLRQIREQKKTDSEKGAETSY